MHGHAGRSVPYHYRGVMIQKTQRHYPCLAFRPIDIYALLVRKLSTIQMRAIERCKKNIAHELQHATHGGIKTAICRMNAYIEKSLDTGNRALGLVVDSSKLYSSI